ncbi:hypothetical protein C5167_006658 [Papaver somniferum]|uniref:Uncharacterized protein n=1 Tax=Papaver somniferum TaxID=3469 RepID=A0A4Y7JH38_PAPSO|nr:hypothetical protein C5167_006658 [Papaver somniferum]
MPLHHLHISVQVLSVIFDSLHQPRFSLCFWRQSRIGKKKMMKKNKRRSVSQINTVVSLNRAILNLNSLLSSDGFVVLQFGLCSYSNPLSSCPGKTPLHLAAQGGSLECVQECLA